MSDEDRSLELAHEQALFAIVERYEVEVVNLVARYRAEGIDRLIANHRAEYDRLVRDSLEKD